MPSSRSVHSKRSWYSLPVKLTKSGSWRVPEESCNSDVDIEEIYLDAEHRDDDLSELESTRHDKWNPFSGLLSSIGRTAYDDLDGDLSTTVWEEDKPVGFFGMFMSSRAEEDDCSSNEDDDDYDDDDDDDDYCSDGETREEREDEYEDDDDNDCSDGEAREERETDEISATTSKREGVSKFGLLGIMKSTAETTESDVDKSTSFIFSSLTFPPLTNMQRNSLTHDTEVKSGSEEDEVEIVIHGVGTDSISNALAESSLAGQKADAEERKVREEKEELKRTAIEQKRQQKMRKAEAQRAAAIAAAEAKRLEAEEKKKAIQQKKRFAEEKSATAMAEAEAKRLEAEARLAAAAAEVERMKRVEREESIAAILVRTAKEKADATLAAEAKKRRAEEAKAAEERKRRECKEEKAKKAERKRIVAEQKLREAEAKRIEAEDRKNQLRQKKREAEEERAAAILVLKAKRMEAQARLAAAAEESKRIKRAAKEEEKSRAEQHKAAKEQKKREAKEKKAEKAEAQRIASEEQKKREADAQRAAADAPAEAKRLEAEEKKNALRQKLRGAEEKLAAAIAEAEAKRIEAEARKVAEATEKERMKREKKEEKAAKKRDDAEAKRRKAAEKKAAADKKAEKERMMADAAEAAERKRVEKEAEKAAAAAEAERKKLEASEKKAQEKKAAADRKKREAEEKRAAEIAAAERKRVEKEAEKAAAAAEAERKKLEASEKKAQEKKAAADRKKREAEEKRAEEKASGSKRSPRALSMLRRGANDSKKEEMITLVAHKPGKSRTTNNALHKHQRGMNANKLVNGGGNVALVYQEFNNDPMHTMKVHQYNSIPVITENSDEVLVHVQASTVSYSDCLIRQGLWWGEGEIRLPATPGVDVVGRVSRCSKTALQRYGIQPGDCIASLIRTGGNARYVKIDASKLVTVPKEVDPASAACLVETYLAAFQSLHLSEDTKIRYRNDALLGKTVLIIGGIAMVGQAMIELALHAGASTVYVTARQKHYNFLQSLGAVPLPIDSSEWLPHVIGRMDTVIDASCIDEYKTVSLALNSKGKLVCIRTKDSTEDEPGLLWHADALWSKFGVSQTYKYTYDVFESWEENLMLCKKDLTYLFKLLSAGMVKPPISDRIPLTQVPQVQRVFETKRIQGYFVCEPWMKGTQGRT